MIGLLLPYTREGQKVLRMTQLEYADFYENSHVIISTIRIKLGKISLIKTHNPLKPIAIVVECFKRCIFFISAYLKFMIKYDVIIGF